MASHPTLSAIKDRERAFWILQDTLVNGIITIFIHLPALYAVAMMIDLMPVYQ